MTESTKKEIELLNNVETFNHNINKIDNVNKLTLKVDKYSLDINKEHFNKIKNNFLSDISKFDLYAWNMLFRYKSYFGDKEEGVGHHAAVPVSVMKKFKDLFNVNYECFASPLNNYFSDFNSAFGDVDCYFGSLGSFFSTQFASGFFEANPPFIEELMNYMADHMLRCLEKSENNDLSLCFIIIVPYWNNPPIDGMIKLRKSLFCNKTHIIPANKHTFLSGLQHKEEKNKIAFKAVHDTEILFMQTTKASEKCPITLDKIKQIENEWFI
jgi:phosphorylated CTD-interacting factor 1